MDGRIANYASPPVYLTLACFELGFNQRDDFTGWTQQCNGGGEDFLEGNKRTINYDQIGESERRWKFGGCYLPGIGFFHNYDARIGSQSPSQLALAHIDSVNFQGAPLEQTVRKAAGGGSQIYRG